MGVYRVPFSCNQMKNNMFLILVSINTPRKKRKERNLKAYIQTDRQVFDSRYRLFNILSTSFYARKKQATLQFSSFRRSPLKKEILFYRRASTANRADMAFKVKMVRLFSSKAAEIQALWGFLINREAKVSLSANVYQIHAAYPEQIFWSLPFWNSCRLGF